jgi:hypothetical protein
MPGKPAIKSDTFPKSLILIEKTVQKVGFLSQVQTAAEISNNQRKYLGMVLPALEC